MVKNLPAVLETRVWFLVWKDPLKEDRATQKLQYYCLENPHGQWSLVGYSLWGCNELDTTE